MIDDFEIEHIPNVGPVLQRKKLLLCPRCKEWGPEIIEKGGVVFSSCCHALSHFIIDTSQEG